MRAPIVVAALLACVAIAGLPASEAGEQGQRAQRFLQRLKRDDKNGDGKVTREEFTGPQRLFERLDGNRDGAIDRQEATQAVQAAQRRRPGMGQRPLPEGIEEIRDVVFGKGGGRELKLDIIRPTKRPAGRMPVVVWVHGGAWRGGDKGGRRTLALAQRGYFTVSIEYRLTHEAIFPAQIQDCKCAIRWLRAHAREYGIDPDRIGVWGSSAGGHLVALLGTSGGAGEFEGDGGWPDQSSCVHAVCDFFGPTDFTRMREGESTMDHDAPDSPESKLVGGPVQESKEACRRADPITYVTPDDPPFLICHGEQDRTVPINQSEFLHAALKKAGVDVTFVRVKRGGHGFRGDTDPSPERIQQRVAEFFDKHLKGIEPKP